jgi:hypothetical protein
MNKILAKRYAFCDFSKIVGFPNPVPSRDEWENSIPRFRGEEWEVPAEHLLDFHDLFIGCKLCMRMFRSSSLGFH